MKIKKGFLSTEIEFTRSELKDKKFINKVKKEILPSRYDISHLSKLLVKLGLIKIRGNKK